MSLMLAQMGLQLFQGVAGWPIAKSQNRIANIQRDMQIATQEYRNNMSAIASAQSHNAVTYNENQVRDAAVEQGLSIQTQAMQEQGAATVAAASAGVKGGSVEAVMQNMRRGAARANYNRLKTLRSQYTAFNSQRRSIEMNKAMNKDITVHPVIPKPDPLSHMLGVGTNLLKVWDSHQAPEDTIAGRLSGNYQDDVQGYSNPYDLRGSTNVNYKNILNGTDLNAHIASGGLY